MFPNATKQTKKSGRTDNGAAAATGSQTLAQHTEPQPRPKSQNRADTGPGGPCPHAPPGGGSAARAPRRHARRVTARQGLHTRPERLAPTADHVHHRLAPEQR